MNLEELKVYQLSMELGNKVWDIVKKWDYFSKDTIGKQIVKSADSIAANISEGFGRFHFKDNINYNYFSSGSLYETKTWTRKAFDRKLIDSKTYSELIDEMELIAKLLNSYIKSIKSESIKQN
jgi:four helix bundle protein